MYRYIMMDGGRYGHTLCATELEHRLHILAEEGGFDGHLVGQIFVDDTCDALKDLSQPEVWVALSAHIDDSHHHEIGLIAYNSEHAISHDVSTGVDT